MKYIKLVSDRVKTVWVKVKPPRTYSWQTLILASFVSALIVIICQLFFEELELFQNIVSAIGQILLIAGIYWLGIEKSCVLTPWITGALICLFAFSHFNEQGNLLTIPEMALVAFPVVSAIIAILPSFFDDRLNVKFPSYAEFIKIIILFFSQVLVACWLQFYLVVQGWFQDYPSLLSDEINRSVFVVNVDPRKETAPKGIDILNAIGMSLQQELNELPWEELEKWMTESKLESKIESIRQAVSEETSSVMEKELWQIDENAVTNNSGYTLHLKAIWNGPQSRPSLLSLMNCEKKCNLEKGYNRGQEVVQIDCEPARKIIRKN
ncbi:DUF5357 family protein [Lusitaniella coriacea LEGE 07157]|uniref:DUF5357 family protein n=1 Tax=Lusitaniella coriacea LEGE 07157 TaxID=945747 RepID=A0A8J7JCG1_9CYAN|nr:DUF5357 family protein [Lusitaniella coriacea]MBE9117420.1 DUF5357 family protein [Lusitaniella coriacea LEGE 07157]